jgi:hypothetical protein
VPSLLDKKKIALPGCVFQHYEPILFKPLEHSENQSAPPVLAVSEGQVGHEAFSFCVPKRKWESATKPFHFAFRKENGNLVHNQKLCLSKSYAPHDRYIYMSYLARPAF